MSRSRMQRPTPRRRLLGGTAFAVLVAGLVGPAGLAVLVAGLVGPAGGASTTAIGLCVDSAARASHVVCASKPPQETLGVRWQ